MILSGPQCNHTETAIDGHFPAACFRLLYPHMHTDHISVCGADKRIDSSWYDHVAVTIDPCTETAHLQDPSCIGPKVVLQSTLRKTAGDGGSELCMS